MAQLPCQNVFWHQAMATEILFIKTESTMDLRSIATGHDLLSKL